MRTYDGEQRCAIDDPGSAVVNACPGSGKTTLIVGKIIKETYALEQTARAVLCLTFTRAAVRSVKDKLRTSIGDSELPGCTVSTIHGFVLNQIFRPYSALINFDDRVRLVSPLSTEYQAYANAVFQGNHTALEKLRHVRRGADGQPISNGLKREKVLEFWDLLEDVSLIDFPSLLYYGYRLVERFNWIADGVAARYKWIIVDEYQDTSILALAILEKFRVAARSRFLLVGDTRQRIYSFAGVEIDQLRTFSSALTPSRYSLAGSYRCGAAICVDGSRLIPKPNTFSSNRDVDDDHSVTEFARVRSISDAILAIFLPRLTAMKIELCEAAILGPAARRLAALAESLRNTGIPVTGAPTRSYVESAVSAFSEAVAAFQRNPTPKNHRVLEETFEQLYHDSEDEDQFEGYREEAMRTFDAVCAVILDASAVSIIATLDQAFGIINSFGQLLGLNDLIGERWNSLKAELAQVADPRFLLAEQTDNRGSLTISTIHGSKGLEYRAVTLIQLNEGTMPHAYSLSQADISEDRRKLFVGLTRAMDYVLYLSDTEDSRNRISRFVKELQYPK